MALKILKAHKYFEQAGILEAEVVEWEQFSIKQIYLKLRGDFPKVSWRRLTCNNSGAPRWIFILYLSICGRLLTKDRLAKWGCIDDVQCPLCEAHDEGCEHLFFTCNFSKQIWTSLLKRQGIARQAMNWQQEIQWALTHARGRSTNAEIYRMTLAGSIYHIWKERNTRVFQGKRRVAAIVVRQIVQEVHC
ncbi:uncharacterized protein LOC132643835 [Lycium barbarum]|uniref:uncharacterized protein LOC132643835 n=1 Tax=Lycium barbarum TaxID=112863 RepID=UPI00293E7D02|nr:uncharacterized protein LOC132643835 [Lycium barbarum]